MDADEKSAETNKKPLLAKRKKKKKSRELHDGSAQESTPDTQQVGLRAERKKMRKPTKQEVEKRPERTKVQKGNEHDPAQLTLFVGQLPYTTTSQQLQRHFVSQGLQGEVTVRLLTDKNTGKSRGMAFVQFSTEADVQTALKLHKSKLHGRQINVERTASGGGAGTKRQGRLDKMRTGQEARRFKQVRRFFDRIVNQLQEAPAENGGGGQAAKTLGLMSSDADERVLELLMSVPEDMAAKSLREFAAQPERRPVWNRPAFLMSTLRKMFEAQSAEGQGQQQDALEKFTVREVGDPPRMEMAAGAIICQMSDKDVVLGAVPQAWQKQQIKGMMPSHAITEYQARSSTDSDSSLLAVHLAPEGATALHSNISGSPRSLSKLFASGTAKFQYGLRAGSQRCAGPHRAEIMPPKAEVESPPSSSPKFRYIELFAGIGGFRAGLDVLGGQCVFSSEIDAHARKTYNHNFGEMPAGDIAEIEAGDVPEFDILTAGFPCQPFSIAGDQEGTGDAKGVLFLEVTRILYERRPSAFILENVPQVKELDNGRVMETILMELRNAGYAVTHRVLNARPLVPQRRQRLYWIGFDRKRGGDEAVDAFRWPCWADDGDTDIQEHGKTTWYSSETGPLPMERQRGWKVVGDILESPETVWAAHELTAVKMDYVARQDAYWNHSLQYHFVNERGAARTLIGSYLKLGRSDQLVGPPESQASDGTSQKRPRLFTARECCRLMGFPEWYNMLGEKRAYHELGNAVCPPVVTAIAEQMLATGVIPTVQGSTERAATKRSKGKRKLASQSTAVDSRPDVSSSQITGTTKTKKKVSSQCSEVHSPPEATSSQGSIKAKKKRKSSLSGRDGQEIQTVRKKAKRGVQSS